MRKYLLSGSFYGKLILFIGLLVCVPIVVLPFYPEEARYAPSFLLPMFFSLILGFVICRRTYRLQESTYEWQSPLQRGSLPVLFVWCYSFLIGALPFVISGRLDFTHAIFESVSGWTTTGMTVVDVTSLPHIFLFHRSFMQFCGGLGFILMIAMVIQSKQSMNLYNAEGHFDRLMPNLRQTARSIFSLYSGFLVVGIILYKIFGMSLFDAVCHAMAALSTSGFTTQSGSIGAYGSLPIEIVTILLMLTGASNFAILLSLTEGRIRQIFRVSETRFMFGLIIVSVPLLAISLAAQMKIGILESLRNALFGVVTIFSTTGYSITDYSGWPPFALGILMILMLIGGCAGSTAGGIKLLRVYFLLRIMRENIRKRLSSARKVTSLTYHSIRGETPIDDSIIVDTTGFIACYMCIFIIGTLLMTLTEGCSLFDAMFEFASAFCTVGITNGLTGPHTNTLTLLVEMAGMILGRLEIFIVFVGIYSGVHMLKLRFRRKQA